MVGSAAALVAQRPEDYGWVVLVPFDHSDCAFHEGGVPLRLVREQAAHAVRFEVGFVNQINAGFVAQVVPCGVVWIMRRADGIEIVGLEQLDILEHSAYGNSPAVVGIVLVPVDTEELDGFAVDEKLAVLNFNLTEADPAAFDFDGFAAGILECYYKGIQIRRLCGPLARILDCRLEQAGGYVSSLRVSLADD